jgi:hypothetical protein
MPKLYVQFYSRIATKKVLHETHFNTPDNDDDADKHVVCLCSNGYYR